MFIKHDCWLLVMFIHYKTVFPKNIFLKEINLILTWSANCVIVYTSIANQDALFAITETKLCVSVVTISS